MPRQITIDPQKILDALNTVNFDTSVALSKIKCVHWTRLYIVIFLTVSVV